MCVYIYYLFRDNTARASWQAVIKRYPRIGVHTGRPSLPLLIYSLPFQSHRMGFKKALLSGLASIFDRKKRANDGNRSEHLEADTSVSQQQNEDCFGRY
jgi:hypothetical protein